MRCNTFYAITKNTNKPEDSNSYSRLDFFLARTSIALSRGMGKAILYMI